MKSIDKSVDVFHNETPEKFTVHYDSTTALSRKLYDMLMGWPEMHQCLANAKIAYIVPDDLLYGIPFSCLTPAGGEDTPYLINKAALVNLPCMSLLKFYAGKNDHQDFRNKRLLLSVDCDFEGAHDLIDFIKKEFPHSEQLAIQKSNIGKEDILSKLNEEYDIYVLMGHSAVNTKIPDLSVINLTAINPLDSIVTTSKVSLAELKRVNWAHAELVVLIGCETAKGKLYKGSGFAGIQQCILALGAQEVLATLWKIDSNRAVEQIKDIFTSLTEKRSTAYALRDVQIQTIQNLKSNEFYKKPHPYLWGYFTLLQTSGN